MGITGNLKTMELAELLQWVSQGNKTGTLVIDDGDVKKRIFFREGRIISSASTDPREHLGHFLVSHGFITEEELSKAVAMQEQSKMLLGKILTTIGAISEEDLHRLLRLKAEESVYDLFSWEEGEFRFVDEELPERTMVPLNLDATSIVLEGVQRLDEWKRIREVIPSAQAIPVAMGDLLDDPKLSPGARKILEQVDDDRTVEEIQIQTHSSEFMVSKVLFDAHRKGKLKVIRPRGAAPSGTSPGVGQGAATAPPDQDVGANELITRAERFLKEGRFEQGLRHLRAARSLEPDAKAVQQALEKGEKLVGDRVSLAGVHPDAVPVLKRTMQELTELQLTAQQGFILTRVNGSYDIRSIVKISPMPQIDALLVFYRLLEQDHIELK
ncbi:MAG: DUF4388 domain-containing protein [Thermoanaerobaculia bacterium]